MKDDVENMKQKIKLFLIPFMLLATLFLATACSGDPTAYDQNDAAGHNVSVKFDANGGFFVGTSSIMVDSFNIAGMQTDANGKVNLKLLDPASNKRGDFSISNGNLVLAGWYQHRTPTTDSNGNVTYTYSGKFNFDTDTVAVDPNQTHTSADPVITLYAVWVPKFEIEFISLNTNESLGVYAYNPVTTDTIQLPDWNQDTGKMDMFKFPSVKGMTFDKAYYDAEKTRQVDAEEGVIHHGNINPETGVAENITMKLYVEYTEGEWYHIYKAEQLNAISNPAGLYVIEEDLDFTNAVWPSVFATGEFTGKIYGNGKTIQNVKAYQDSNTNYEVGLFGKLGAGAVVENVTFENVEVVIDAGTTLMPGATFGLLAGVINAEAVLTDVQITSGKIVIDTDRCNWRSEDFVIGLLCGLDYGNNLANIDYSNITCEATGEKNLKFDYDGNEVTFQEVEVDEAQ